MAVMGTMVLDMAVTDTTDTTDLATDTGTDTDTMVVIVAILTHTVTLVVLEVSSRMFKVFLFLSVRRQEVYE